MTPIVWFVTFAVVCVLVFFIWDVAVIWKSKVVEKYNMQEESNPKLVAEDLIYLERSFN